MPGDTGKWIPLYEMLGVTIADGKRVSDDFASLVRDSESPSDLCRKVVELHGADAVCMSICLQLALETIAVTKKTVDWRAQCPARN